MNTKVVLAETKKAKLDSLIQNSKNRYDLIENKFQFFYNAGTLALQLDKPHLALALLSQAYKFDPFDNDLHTNLSIAESNAEESSLIYPTASMYRFFDKQPIVLVWLICTFPGLLLSLIFILQIKVKKLTLISTSVFCITLTATAIFIALQIPLKQGVVVDDKTIIRSGPGKNFSQYLTVNGGSIVAVERYDESKNWIKIRFFDSTDTEETGWIAKKKMIRLYNEE